MRSGWSKRTAAGLAGKPFRSGKSICRRPAAGSHIPAACACPGDMDRCISKMFSAHSQRFAACPGSLTWASDLPAQAAPEMSGAVPPDTSRPRWTGRPAAQTAPGGRPRSAAPSLSDPPQKRWDHTYATGRSPAWADSRRCDRGGSDSYHAGNKKAIQGKAWNSTAPACFRQDIRQNSRSLRNNLPFPFRRS